MGYLHIPAYAQLDINRLGFGFWMPRDIETIVFLDSPMFLRSFKLFTAAWLTVLLLVACGGGGSAAPAPTGFTAVATAESTVTLTWNMVPGVEYWVFYGPDSIAPKTTGSMGSWIGLAGGGSKTQIFASTYTVTGLANGTKYWFSVNGRTDGGPGGPGADRKSATPMFAGWTWTAGPATVNNSVSNDLLSAMFGTSYVAAGANGAMFSSPDGTTWSAINYATSTKWNGASFFGSYLLVGDAGAILTSPDTVTWTPRTSGTAENLYAIASNSANRYVAVGANDTIITSTDAVNWSPVTSMSPATTQSFYGVTYSSYNNGTWVAVGAAGTMYESADGLSWHSVTSSTLNDLRGITYGASTFVAVGSSGTVLSSGDGLTWTAQTLPVTPPVTIDLKAVLYSTQFVAVGTGGNAFYSTDGITWTASAATGTSADLNALARGGLVDLAVGASGTNLLAK